MKRIGDCTLWVGAGLTLVAGLLLSGINLYWGELNQDEGWYLYAAARTAEGARPYADFAFTQGPVFTAVYAQLFRIWPVAGLQAGRLFTALLGWATIGLGIVLVRQLAPPAWRGTATVGVLALLGANVYHNYFSLIVKTYALTGLLLTAAACCLAWLSRDRLRGPALAAGWLFALAAGVRLSAGVWLPVSALGLVLAARRYPRAWLWFGLGGVLGLAVAFGPSLLRAPAATWFWLGPFHWARAATDGHGGWLYRAGFFSRWLQAYYLLAAVAVVAGWGLATSGVRRHVWPPSVGSGLLAGVGGMTLLHAAAPFPYDDYQVPVMVIGTALVLAALCHWLARLIEPSRQPAWARAVGGILVMTGLLAAATSPRNQEWFVLGRDRIWWPVKEQADLRVLQQTAQFLAERTAPGDELLTQDTYLAVEAGLRVPAGLNLGPFAYFPDWPTDVAVARHVVNRPLLEALLQSGTAEWAAFSDYGLAIAGPGMTPVAEAERQRLLRLLEWHYEPYKTVPHFGQAHTPLTLYRRRAAP